MKYDREEANEIIVEQSKEIERLNNIIIELEKYISDTRRKTFEKAFNKSYGKVFNQAKMEVYTDLQNKIKELKENK